ncbi:MAG TPA: GspH/FimT family protein, partial [Vicinamibacterales bacterium]|nr:GspH/FimT family protein [Vicinamibacterales bacterium]
VAVLAVLSAAALPELRSFMASQMVKTPASDLYASLVLARSEAIKRNAAIDIVPAATDWAKGWEVRSGGTALRTQNGYPTRVSISSSVAGTVTYGGNGRLSTSATNFRVLVPSDPKARMRCVSVDVTGRPSVRVDKNMDQTACD